MRRIIIAIVLCLLTLGANAQTKKTVNTRKVTTHYTAQPSMKYIGLTMGAYTYSGKRDYTHTIFSIPETLSDVPYVYHAALFGVQGGYLYSLFGDMNKAFTPYVGGEATVGISAKHDVGLGIQAGVNAGIMLGKPSFRLDLRIQPQLTYFGSGTYYYDFCYAIEYEEDSSIQPGLAIRAGLWISHFNFYFQYNKKKSKGIEGSVGFGIAWRF